MDCIRPQCFSARKRCRLSSSFRASSWLLLRNCTYSLQSWGRTYSTAHVYIFYKDTLVHVALHFSVRVQKLKPGWLPSSAACPELPPGCGPPSRSASCCPVGHTIHVTSLPFFLMASPVLMTDYYFFIFWEVSGLFIKILIYQITHSVTILTMPRSY